MRTILCRRGKGEEALARMRELMGKLKLTATAVILSAAARAVADEAASNGEPWLTRTAP
jgi:hypothetical protein